MSDGWGLAVEGMERSYAAAKAEWKAAALEAVFLATQRFQFITADEVWACFPKGYSKDNGSALGHVMREAKALGWIVNTGEFRIADKPTMHCKARPVWKSLIYGEV